MAEVRIEQSGASATVVVDGVTLKGVTRLALEMDPRRLPLVTIDLAAFNNAVELSDAALKIGGIDAPEALERAILAHLSEKYAPTGRLPSAGEMAASIRSVVQSVAADLVRLPVKQTAQEQATPGPSGLTTLAPIGGR